MRDVIAAIADKRINTLRPETSYAVVQSINREGRSAQVLYMGDTDPVTVALGSIEPATVGQTVRDRRHHGPPLRRRRARSTRSCRATTPATPRPVTLTPVVARSRLPSTTCPTSTPRPTRRGPRRCSGGTTSVASGTPISIDLGTSYLALTGGTVTGPDHLPVIAGGRDDAERRRRGHRPELQLVSALASPTSMPPHLPVGHDPGRPLPDDHRLQHHRHRGGLDDRSPADGHRRHDRHGHRQGRRRHDARRSPCSRTRSTWAPTPPATTSPTSSARPTKSSRTPWSLAKAPRTRSAFRRASTSTPTPTFTRVLYGQATGTSPMAVASTTLVANLTANYLGAVNQDAAFFQNASNLNAGAVPNARLSGAYTGITGLGTLTTLTVAGDRRPRARNSTVAGRRHLARRERRRRLHPGRWSARWRAAHRRTPPPTSWSP